MEVDDLEHGNHDVVDGPEVEPTHRQAREQRGPQGNCRVSMLGRRVPPRLAVVDAEVQVLAPSRPLGPPSPGSRLLALDAAMPLSATGQEDVRWVDSPLEWLGEVGSGGWWG